MTRVSQTLDRVHVTFDDDNLVANAGLLLPATLTERLGLEALVDATVRLDGLVGGASPGRKVLTLLNTMLAGGSHIDHADMLRAGATAKVVSHRVMAPSTLGTFLRAFTFGHVRQLEAVNDLARQRAWAMSAAPGGLVIDVDSTICEVAGKSKQGAGYGYTHCLGYHPLLATIAGTGEILHGRLRKGSANTQRGTKRFVNELVARARRDDQHRELTVRFDSGFWNNDTIVNLESTGCALHDGRADQCCGGADRDRGHRRRRLAEHRLHTRWRSPSRRVRLHVRPRNQTCDPPDDRSPDPPHRQVAAEAVA